MLRSRAPSQLSNKRYRSSTYGQKKSSKKTDYKRYDNNPRYFVSMGRQFLPKMLKQTMCYFDEPSINMALGTGTSTIYQISCNSLFDPNATGTGHQPYGFDQISALYDHYTVVSSRIKVTPCIAPDVANGVVAFFMWIDDDTSTSTTVTTNVERTSSKTIYMCPATGWVSNGTGTLYHSWSAKEAFGPGTLADSTMQGSATTSPTEQQYFSLGMFNPQVIAMANCFFAVEVEYDVIWDELVTLSGS